MATGYKNRYIGVGLINPNNMVMGTNKRKIPMPIFHPF
jgi:hypothetical protein